MSRDRKIATAILAQQHAAQVALASRVCRDRAASERLRSDEKTRRVYLGRGAELQQQAAFEYAHARKLLGVE